jgi:hypothetical protein
LRVSHRVAVGGNLRAGIVSLPEGEPHVGRDVAGAKAIGQRIPRIRPIEGGKRVSYLPHLPIGVDRFLE